MLLGWLLGRCQQDACARSWAGGSKMYTKYSGSLSLRKQAQTFPELTHSHQLWSIAWGISLPFPENQMQAQKKWSLLHELGQFSLAPYCHNLRVATSLVPLLFPIRSIWSCSYLADNAALLGLLNCLHTCPAGLLDSYTRPHSESATHLLPAAQNSHLYAPRFTKFILYPTLCSIPETNTL